MIASAGDGLFFLNIFICLRMRAQEGITYKGFSDSVPLRLYMISVCFLRSVTFSCNEILHILVWGKNQPLSTASSVTMMHAVQLSKRLTLSPTQTEMYPASANFAPLRSDLPARAGTISTVCAGSRTGWCNLEMFDPGVCQPSETENTLVDCWVV